MKESFFFLLLLFSNNIFAQFKITGRVKDRQNTPIPFASLRLVPLNDTLKVQMVLTDTQGSFVFTNVKSNRYAFIAASSLYESVRTIITVDHASLQMDDIIMNAEKRITLNGVSVKGAAPVMTQKLDRLVVNVKGTPIGTSGNALQVLERLPGIEVSADGTTIKLNGKDQVGILINGKLTRVPVAAVLLMLSSTNAKDIEKIELINNPPAQYDAEFTGGLINIQQVVNTTDGSNGSILLGLGYGWREKAKAGINWNIRKGRANLYGGLNYDRNSNPRKFNYDSYNRGDRVPYTNHTITNRYPVITGVTGRLGLDYDLNKKVAVGLLANGNMNLFKQRVDGYSRGTDNIGLVNNEDSRRRLYMINGHIGYKISQTQLLNADVDYLNFYSFAPNEYINTYYTGGHDSVSAFIVTKRTPVNVWTGKLDYSSALNKRLEINAGAKVTISRLKNNVSATNMHEASSIQLDSINEHSTLAENITALYASANWAPGHHTKMNVGLRYEYSTQDLRDVDGLQSLHTSLGQFFPSVFVSHVFDRNNSLQFAYSRRIARPTYFDLAPFVSFIDPNTYYIGNINLRPAFSNIFSLTYLMKRFIFTAECTREKNAIAKSQPVFLEDPKQQMLTSLNIPTRWISSLSVGLPLTVNSWWNMLYNLQLTYITQELGYGSAPRSNTSYALKATQNFKVDKHWLIQLFASYNSDKLYGTTKVDGFQRVDVSVSKDIKAWHSSFQLSINDVFGRYYNFQSVNDPRRYYKEFDEYEPRVIRLTFTHDFGNMQLKKEAKRETSSEEIRNRF